MPQQKVIFYQSKRETLIAVKLVVWWECGKEIKKSKKKNLKKKKIKKKKIIKTKN